MHSHHSTPITALCHACLLYQAIPHPLSADMLLRFHLSCSIVHQDVVAVRVSAVPRNQRDRRARHTGHVQVHSTPTHSQHCSSPPPNHATAELLSDTFHWLCLCARYLGFLWNQYSDPKYDPTGYEWTYYRTQDMQTSIMWLYDNYPQDRQQFLLDLNELLYNNSFDWVDYYQHRLPTTNVSGWNMNDHGVNNGQALKSAAVQYRASHNQSDVDSTYLRMHKMDKYHGQASGIFSCDECLAGLNPSRGTELCTVVEAMFSYGTIFSILGDTVFADKVEQIAFNALPATFTADMWAHQYLQQSNEVNAKVQTDPWWNSDSGTAVLYGLEPNMGGCCTSNHPQVRNMRTITHWKACEDHSVHNFTRNHRRC